MESQTYTIRAMSIDGGDRDDMELKGTLDEIKSFLFKNKFSHVSMYWTEEYRITIDEIDDYLLRKYDGKEDQCLYLFYGYINDIKRQLERLADKSTPVIPLWPVRDKQYVVKTSVYSADFWFGSDPLYGDIGIPLDTNFSFMQKLIAYLQDLPAGIGSRETRKAIENFYEQNGLPRDYYHKGFKKPDAVKFYSEH